LEKAARTDIKQSASSFETTGATPNITDLVDFWKPEIPTTTFMRSTGIWGIMILVFYAVFEWKEKPPGGHVFIRTYLSTKSYCFEGEHRGRMTREPKRGS
jgi:hypothetical protein